MGTKLGVEDIFFGYLPQVVASGTDKLLLRSFVEEFPQNQAKISKEFILLQILKGELYDDPLYEFAHRDFIDRYSTLNAGQKSFVLDGIKTGDYEKHLLSVFKPKFEDFKQTYKKMIYLIAGSSEDPDKKRVFNKLYSAPDTD